MAWLPQSLKLVPDPASRSKCVAVEEFKKGSTVMRNDSYVSILLESEKGKRCDACFHLPSENLPLKRCSGCGSFWYCNAQCQGLHWRLNHKRLCQNYNAYIASTGYQALPNHEKLDATLLSHTIAQFSLCSPPYTAVPDSPTEILLSLLPHSQERPPPICPMKPPPPPDLVNQLYSRFGNNNFVIHSHLVSIGHGVFPIASRLFNHSCIPNAAAKYIIHRGRRVQMEIIALDDILPGDEIFVPYLDPALSQTRAQMLEISYGFKCPCSSCKFLSKSDPLPEIPNTAEEKAKLAQDLRNFVGIRYGIKTLPKMSIDAIPRELQCTLREEYMSYLSEAFSKASHEGGYDVALDAGSALLALYIVCYPENYPQIGMHLLELTKTAWNAIVSATNIPAEEEAVLRGRVKDLLGHARSVLSVYGLEGDEGGPFEEIDTLENLLASQRSEAL